MVEAECLSCASDGVAVAPDGKEGAELQLEIARCQVDKHGALCTRPTNKTDKSGVNPHHLADITKEKSGVVLTATQSLTGVENDPIGAADSAETQVHARNGIEESGVKHDIIETLDDSKDKVQEHYEKSAEVVVEVDDESTNKPPEDGDSLKEDTCVGACKSITVKEVPLAPRGLVPKDKGAQLTSDGAADHSLLFEDALVTKGHKFGDELAETDCYLAKIDLPLVSAPKTLIYLPHGKSAPACAHLGLAALGDLASDLICEKKECTGKTPQTYVDKENLTDCVDVGNTHIPAGSKNAIIGDISRLTNDLTISDLTIPLDLATQAVAELKIKVDQEKTGTVSLKSVEEDLIPQAMIDEELGQISTVGTGESQSDTTADCTCCEPKAERNQGKLQAVHCEITCKVATDQGHIYKKQIGGLGQPVKASTNPELSDIIEGKIPEPENQAIGGYTLVEPTGFTEVGAKEVTELGTSVGPLAAGAKVIAIDGQTYLADLLETVPKSVGLTRPKEVVLKVKLATSELTTKAEACMLEEHTGEATGDSNQCCGNTQLTIDGAGAKATDVKALSLETPGHTGDSCLKIQGCVTPITETDLHDEALKSALEETTKVQCGERYVLSYEAVSALSQWQHCTLSIGPRSPKAVYNLEIQQNK